MVQNVEGDIEYKKEGNYPYLKASLKNVGDNYMKLSFEFNFTEQQIEGELQKELETGVSKKEFLIVLKL